MLKLDNDNPLIVDTEHIYHNSPWIQDDTLEALRKRSHKFQRQYRDYDIEYKYNSLGYRTTEISDVADDFLLTFGCSYTEGVGLKSEHIWNHAVTKFLNLDLYNCAKAASGMDIQYYNTTLWKLNNLPIPKMVIVQWPQKARKRFGFRDSSSSIRLNDMSETRTPDGKWWGKRYLVDTGEMSLNAFMWYENFNNIWESLGVPVLNFTWEEDLEEDVSRSKFKLWHVTPRRHDRARDFNHDGPEFHADTAEDVIEILKLNNFTYKV
jgi:hypothetical protein